MLQIQFPHSFGVISQGELVATQRVKVLNSTESGQTDPELGSPIFLNQARAGHRPVHAWFLRITSVRECWYACVCVSVPEAINN